MIWKKKKDAAAQSAEAAGEMTGAKGRTGAGAFAKKNWKWLVPLVVVAAAGAVFLINKLLRYTLHVFSPHASSCHYQRGCGRMPL